jgi:hypothetical protein
MELRKGKLLSPEWLLFRCDGSKRIQQYFWLSLVGMQAGATTLEKNLETS